MTTLLKKLGDNWHADHVYQPLIHQIVPTSQNKKAIENLLIELYVDEHNDFRLFKNKGVSTIYDDDIDVCKARKKETEEALKREEEAFRKLLEKFQQLEPPEVSSHEQVDEEEDEEEVEVEVEVNQKGKGLASSGPGRQGLATPGLATPSQKTQDQKACKRSLKAEEQHKRMLAKGIKSSMASSQQKLMELNDYIQQLDKKAEYYVHYQKASRQYLHSTRDAVHRYIESKDLEVLISEMDSVIGVYERMMRRSVPVEGCKGSKDGLCETHLLPLSLTVYPNEGYKNVLKCKVSP
jgi:hypothetical protein